MLRQLRKQRRDLIHSNRSMIVFLLLGALCAGCSNVQVIRLTSETYAPRPVAEVAILSQEPSASHTQIAELTETSTSTVEELQEHILKKAAELGADAVVFSASIARTEQRTDFQPMYSPWGYYAPSYYGPGPYGYWGPWGYHYGAWGPGWGGYRPYMTAPGYRPYMAMPYVVRVNTVKGVAIKYS